MSKFAGNNKKMWSGHTPYSEKIFNCDWEMSGAEKGRKQIILAKSLRNTCKRAHFLSV